ncbi:hypothetical protein HL92_004032 [Salmonella enterica]|nr:hypothetical protein [Salmonella enterica]
MNEFRRWKGEQLKEKKRSTLHSLTRLLLQLAGILAVLELLFVVWVMSGSLRNVDQPGYVVAQGSSGS